mmetsp:Transcript_25515/g.31430  ORF Transcript_25515/g.31430 Transcript_25515/m.31430 type:complete len:404 (+) Transcript_25515:505-1716(+)
MTLFTTMLTLHSIRPQFGDAFYNILSPGATVLAKWLPVFFVPSLVTLPLASSLGSTTEVLKILAVVISGFYFTLFSTAYSVLAVRKLTSKSKSKPIPIQQLSQEFKAVAPITTPPKQFSDSTFNTLSIGTIITGIATLITQSNPNLSILLKTPIEALFMLFTTLSTFTFGARLPISFRKIVHPLVTCTALIWLQIKLVSSLLLKQKSFYSFLQSYKVGSLCPVHLGAGDILLFMLGPSVIALACQMYDRKKLMKENMKEVMAAVSVSSIGGLFGTASLVRLINLTNPIIRLSLLSRNITSPLAMAIATIVGADVSLAVSMVVITGLFGANFGASILSKAKINDPVARGLGIGAAAHGLGTAAFSDEKDAFPFAAIAMALTASACTVLVSIPVIKSLVVKVALG